MKKLDKRGESVGSIMLGVILVMLGVAFWDHSAHTKSDREAIFGLLSTTLGITLIIIIALL